MVTIIPAAAASAQGLEVRLGEPTGKRLTALHFATSCEFYRPGLTAGVGEKRDELAAALDASGIRALRFPGGNAAYWYLPESREATWAISPHHVRGGHFVPMEGLAAFCREADVQLIYELPCLFYLDGEQPRAMVESSESKAKGYYDRDRVEEGVEYGLGIARRLLEIGAPVAVWEMGNEEFAHCAVEDYAAVVAGYARGLRNLNAEIPIVVVGMGKGWLQALVPLLREVGVLDLIHSDQVHYPFGNWPGPGSEEKKADAAAFVMGDLKMERFLDAHKGGKDTLDSSGMPTSVTETTTMRFQNWDPHAVIGTHAHGLCYAWNWMTLLERPEVDMAVFHDLETPFFGMLRYDVGFDPAARRFTWLEQAGEDHALAPTFPGGFVLSPTGFANRLLSELVGEEIVETGLEPSPELRVLASSERVIAVSRQAEPQTLTVPFERAKAETLTADDLASCLPGRFRITDVAVEAANGRVRVALPPWSVTAIRRG